MKLTDVLALPTGAASSRRPDGAALHCYLECGGARVYFFAWRWEAGLLRKVILPDLPERDGTDRQQMYPAAELEARAAALGFTDWSV